MIPLLVDLETEWRGGQNQAFLLIKGLYERGHAAELVAAKGSSLGHRCKKEGFYVHYVSRGAFRVAAAAKIRQVVSDGRIDLIHANEAHAVSAAWLSGATRKIPFVISRRVGYPIGSSRIARARYNAADRILANSQWVAEQAVNSGAPSDKMRVVYEGTEIPARFNATQREMARKRWGLARDTPVLGCVGKFLEDKGQEWLIRALPEIRKDFPGAKLLLAGDGPLRHELGKLAAEMNLQDAVIFAGFVKDVETVYAVLDVFLLPSFFEALNNSLLAAMAYEIPSIAFRCGALPEIVEDGRSGLLVSGPEVGEIAAATKKILGDPEFAKKLGAAGRERVEQHFSAERMVERTVQIYGELLGMVPEGSRVTAAR
jgi:glycosyltransferase involved in cell wall biosynthesis